jgi:hypothetical protein
MRLGRALRPKEPLHFAVASAAGLLIVFTFLVASWLRPWSPKRGLGLFFGIAAALAFLLEMAYPLRRPKARFFRTAKAWLQIHVYVGAVAFLAVLAHAGFRWPGGAMGWGLLLLSAWVCGSGLLGVFLQKWLPAALAEGLRVEALYERIPSLVEGLTKEADALMADTSEALERFYADDVRPRLSKLSPSWTYLLDVRADRERALGPFERMARFVEPEELPRVADLMSLFTEKLELDAHYAVQGLLRRWLLVHVPPAGLLLALLAIHVYTWVRY